MGGVIIYFIKYQEKSDRVKKELDTVRLTSNSLSNTLFIITEMRFRLGLHSLFVYPLTALYYTLLTL